MILELSSYSWKKDKKTNEYLNEPVDDNNHLCDALRYGIQKIQKNNKLQTLKKGVLGL